MDLLKAVLSLRASYLNSNNSVTSGLTKGKRRGRAGRLAMRRPMTKLKDCHRRGDRLTSPGRNSGAPGGKRPYAAQRKPNGEVGSIDVGRASSDRRGRRPRRAHGGGDFATRGHRVLVYDGAPSPARKFLLAGRGGLNLTHSEPFERFMSRYGAAAERLRPAIERLSPDALRAWSAGLGEETFVGASGRVFPRSFKATPLLRAWLRRLEALGVALRARRRFVGFGEGRTLRFASPEGVEEVEAAGAVLALGGASWPRLGADGSWVEILRAAGIAVAKLRPANCGFAIDWSPGFRQRFAGQPLKTIALRHGEEKVRGEAMIAAYGIEGGAVYALSAPLRDAIEAEGSTTPHSRPQAGPRP